jgi:beta-lactamase class A
MTSGAGSTRSLPAAGTEALRHEAESDAAAAVRSALRELLEAEAARIGGTVAVHVRADNGVEAGVRAEEPMPAASVIKLPVAAAVYGAWESGRLKRTAADERRVRAAITRSDNPGADALINRLGMERINAWLARAGYAETRLRHRMLPLRAIGDARRTNATSARDMTRMLMELLEGKLVSPAAGGALRRVLLDQTRRTRIPAGVPEGVPVGNKTGTLRGIINDVAFVEPPGGPRYALAVLVKDAGPDGPASEAIAALSRKVYRLLTEPRR